MAFVLKGNVLHNGTTLESPQIIVFCLRQIDIMVIIKRVAYEFNRNLVKRFIVILGIPLSHLHMFLFVLILVLAFQVHILLWLNLLGEEVLGDDIFRETAPFPVKILLIIALGLFAVLKVHGAPRFGGTKTWLTNELSI